MPAAWRSPPAAEARRSARGRSPERPIQPAGRLPLRLWAATTEVVRMSAYPAAASPAPSRNVRTITWMYLAGFASLAALAMGALAVTQRLAAAVLLLVAGVGVLVVLPLLYKSRRYAEALLDAEAQLHDHEQLGMLRADNRAASYPTVNVGGNLTVLRDSVAAPGTAVPVAPAAPPSPLAIDPEAADEELADPAREVSAAPEQRDGNIVIAPDGRADGWSSTVARITYLQEPVRSRRGSTTRPAR